MTFILMAMPVSTSKCVSTDSDSILLRKIELSKNSQIFKILNEVISEERQNSRHINFFTLDLKDDMDEIDVDIVGHTKENLSYWDGYTGYVIVDSIPIIVTNNSKQKIRFSKGQNKHFPMDSPYSPLYVYDPPVWSFRIKNEDIARYVPSIGWIWNNPSHDRSKHTGSSFRLTRPIRTSNNK
ncbi:MAG: hypothetical protein K2K25_00840 [Muribaculaceae bacterium]|nr:hypothetical protein [Muribaculaceae bacterium]